MPAKKTKQTSKKKQAPKAVVKPKPISNIGGGQGGILGGFGGTLGRG